MVWTRGAEQVGGGGCRAGWLTLQSWKCSDWMVSWTRWFSCGPTWTDGAEEDTSFRPSRTFLILNFFIFSPTARSASRGGVGDAEG